MGSVFLIAVPVMLVVVVLGPRLLPETRGGVAQRVDPASVALSITAMVTIVYALKTLMDSGASPVPAAPPSPC